MGKKEIEFSKYIIRGDYHWQAMRRNIFSYNSFLAQRYKRVLDSLPYNIVNKKVIDIGCGDGMLSYLIWKKTKAYVVGIDSSKVAISLAINKTKHYNFSGKFIIGSGYKLNFPKNTFDYAILADVIEHLKDPDRIITEINKIIKPGGQLILSTVVKQSNKPEDKLHFKEYTEIELKSFVKKYYTHVRIYTSHPVIFRKAYQYYFKIGKYKPQPLKYLINMFAILGFNSFKIKLGANYCQTIIAKKI